MRNGEFHCYPIIIARIYDVMSVPEFVLDYASPRPRGRLRLPSRSLIRWELNPDDNSTTIVETLAGKQSAIGPLIFGALTLLMITGGSINEALQMRRHPDDTPWFVICATIALVELVVMALVIDQTWAKTIIRASREGLLFHTRSPFRRREFSWREDEIVSVQFESTQDQRDAAPLGKIRIVTTRPPSLTIFADHLHRDLAHVAAVILYGLGRGDALPLPEQGPAATVPQAEPDEATFQRLLTVHNKMRRGE